jgi:8-oxo-dGTP diphosphatase
VDRKAEVVVMHPDPRSAMTTDAGLARGPVSAAPIAAVPAVDSAGDRDYPSFRLATVVYAEREEHILLLRRAQGWLTDRFYLPGGTVEVGETPEEAAIREVREETGLEMVGELELVGAYLVRVAGLECLQLSYRGQLGPGPVRLSDAHNDLSWAEPAVLRLVMNEELFAKIARGDAATLDLLRNVAVDLDRYLACTGRTSPALPADAVLPMTPG